MDALAILFRYLILFEFAVWHLISPGTQGLLREPNAVNSQRHASAQTLKDLLERLRRAQRRKTAGEILQRLLAEVAVSIIREERAVNRSTL